MVHRKLRGSTPLPTGQLYDLQLIQLEKFQRPVKGCCNGRNTGRLNDNVAKGGVSTEDGQELHHMGATDPDDLRGYFIHDANHKFYVNDRFHDLIGGTKRVERVPRR